MKKMKIDRQPYDNEDEQNECGTICELPSCGPGNHGKIISEKDKTRVHCHKDKLRGFCLSPSCDGFDYSVLATSYFPHK